MGRAADTHPTHQAIATRAYELFLSRGATHGNDWADWFTAEHELAQAPPKPATEPIGLAG